MATNDELVQAVIDANAKVVAAEAQRDDAQAQYENAVDAATVAHDALFAVVDQAAIDTAPAPGKLPLEVAAPVKAAPVEVVVDAPVEELVVP